MDTCKGLPILLEAMTRAGEPRLKLLVVGGEAGLVKEYEHRARRNGLEKRVAFLGNRKDVRPALWSADAFAFPSHYETFSLVAFEAAAAGLPLIAPRLHGIEELIRDGENGLVIEQTPESVTAALRRLMALDRAALRSMSERATEDVKGYAASPFGRRWRDLYHALEGLR